MQPSMAIAVLAFVFGVGFLSGVHIATEPQPPQTLPAGAFQRQPEPIPPTDKELLSVWPRSAKT